MAFVLTLTMESPVIQLEKMAFGKARGKNDVQKAGKHVPAGTPHTDKNGNSTVSTSAMMKHSSVTVEGESV